MALNFSTTADGGAITTEEITGIIGQPLEAATVMLQAKPRMVKSNGGVPVRIPQVDNFELADPWRAENTEIGEDDPSFDDLTLLPTNRKSMKVLTRLSNELIRHATVGALETVRDRLVGAMARQLDAAFLTGDGASDTITGLLAQTGTQTMAAVGTPDVDDLHDAHGLALTADAKASAWFMHPRDLITLRKTKGSDGQYIVQPDPVENGSFRLLGLPVHVSTQLPDDDGGGSDESTIVLADMTQIVVAQDLDISVEFLTERYAEFDQTAIRVVSRWDLGLLEPAGIVKLTGVTA